MSAKENVKTAGEAGELEQEMERASAALIDVREMLGRAIFGQQTVIDQTLVTLISGGHGLLVGVPGLAKTLLVESIAKVMGLSEKRVQFTPDLMPPDILGSEVLEESESGERSFRFIKGPIFCELFMADEINRASPRTQSALLQAMQEHKVTIAGKDYALPEPFMVLATQNPIEQEGTYPLPEAQLDRFLMQIQVDYPSAEAEKIMLVQTTGADTARLEAVMDPKMLLKTMQMVRAMPVGEKVVDAIVALVRSLRPEESDDAEVKEAVAWGPGPRGGQALMLAVRAKALLEGRLAPSLEDVRELAAPVLRHRMALVFQARSQGVTIDGLINRLAAAGSPTT